MSLCPRCSSGADCRELDITGSRSGFGFFSHVAHGKTNQSIPFPQQNRVTQTLSGDSADLTLHIQSRIDRLRKIPALPSHLFLLSDRQIRVTRDVRGEWKRSHGLRHDRREETWPEA